MNYKEKLDKAKELKKQADELHKLVDECINNDDFNNALNYMKKSNELLAEYSRIHDEGINEYIDKKFAKKSANNNNFQDKSYEIMDTIIKENHSYDK